MGKLLNLILLWSPALLAYNIYRWLEFGLLPPLAVMSAGSLTVGNALFRSME